MSALVGYKRRAPLVSRSLGSQVVDQLRQLIVTRQIPPGTHLVEATLSVEFDVSRGPIRDALRQLEGEGLVVPQRRGLVTRALTDADIDELYALRSLVELHGFTAAMGGASSWTPAEDAVQGMVRAADAGDAQTFARCDLAFHAAVLALSDQPRFERVWQQYEPTFAVLLGLTNAQDRDLHPTLEDHRRLLEAARKGDAATVAALLSAHMAGSRSRLQHAYEQLVTS